MFFLRRVVLGLILLICSFALNAQQLINKRSTFYVMGGTSGAKLNQFDNMLSARGLTGLRNRYQTFGMGYQARVNDFVLGMELFHNSGPKNDLDEFTMSYRTSRAMVNVGYSFTEESKFQLIHYMSLGAGFLNFQMLPSNSSADLSTFLSDPAQGIILREKNIQKGSHYYGNFLTEIGFHMSYDFDLPGRKEALQILAKVGYSFSPFEGKWNMSGISFDNTQSGAFFRVGAGITLPDRNFFYKDSNFGLYLFRGIHFTRPTAFNEQLENAGYSPLEGMPSNIGLRILGETEGLLYGVDVYNLGMKGRANVNYNQVLNSLRVYANAGYKFIQFKNFGMGAMGGVGFGNIRYTLTAKEKPGFPELFEQREFDGYLKNRGMMIKPELFAEYGVPMTKRKLFDLVFMASAGYEIPLANYRLGRFDMASYMAAPYVSFGVGVRP